jgi:hypothetical protein
VRRETEERATAEASKELFALVAELRRAVQETDSLTSDRVQRLCAAIDTWVATQMGWMPGAQGSGHGDGT